MNTKLLLVCLDIVLVYRLYLLCFPLSQQSRTRLSVVVVQFDRRLGVQTRLQHSTLESKNDEQHTARISPATLLDFLFPYGYMRCTSFFLY
jgi:hypothetical protein